MTAAPDQPNTRPPARNDSIRMQSGPGKLVVAIHGIGSQRRGDTIRAVARQFAAYGDNDAPVMPLGHFHVPQGEVHVSRLDAPEHPLAGIRFAEVFWADIPRSAAATDDTLEETKAWAAAIVSRAKLAHRQLRQQLPEDARIDDDEFALGLGVIEEVAETIEVVERLLWISARAGLLRLDVGKLMRDYIGDVQLVAEFRHHREMILKRFHQTMQGVLARMSPPDSSASTELYIVAHSEGTVVSMLAMLDALAHPDDHDWINSVRGFMTMGSPLDKHAVLWPALFDVAPGRPPENAERPKIAWRNYSDRGDPIGFRVDITAALLLSRGFHVFEFDPKAHDFVFSRYWLPGKAHTEYWRDGTVFNHFIDDVVLRPPSAAKPEPRGTASAAKQPSVPSDRRGVGLFATVVPYVVVVALHFAAIFSLWIVTSSEANTSAAARNITTLASLLLGVTFAARLPRLTRRRRGVWRALAIVTFGVLALPTLCLRDQLFPGASWWLSPVDGLRIEVGRAAAVAAALGVVSIGWCARRRPGLARRRMIGLGAAVVAGAVAYLAQNAPVDAGRALLGGGAFLYLWWLGIQLFDLAFVWHRYIRADILTAALHRCSPCALSAPRPQPAQTSSVSNSAS